MKNKIRINKYIAIYILIAFVPRFILIQFMQILEVPLDESSTLALPAYLVGYDWSYLMGKTRYYYGYGMAILFTPIFGLFKNPLVLYKAILTACAVLQTIPGLIAYHILGKFFHQNNQLIKLFLSIIASYCVCITALSISNEHMLYIIAWMLGWMLLELINCKNYRQRRIYTYIMMFILLYALTCHERSKVFIIAIICIIFLYRLFERKLLVSPVSFLAGISFLYKITLILTSRIQTVIWPATNGGGELANASVSVPFNLLKNKDSWHIWYNIILGQLGTGAVFTGGVLMIVFVLGIWMFMKKTTLVWSKSSNIESRHVQNNYFYVIAFCLLAIGGIIFAQSLTWLENAQNAVIDSTLSEGGRAFTYLRYYFPCVSVAIVLSLNWLLSHAEKNCIKRIMGVTTVFVILLQANFILCIIPLIERTPILNYIHLTYWNFSFIKSNDWTNKYTFLPACIFCVIFFIVFHFLIMKNKNKAALCFLIILLGYQYSMTGIDGIIPRSIENYHAVQATWEVLDKMERDNILPDYIGVSESRILSTHHPVRFIYQFLLRDKPISYYEPVQEVQEAIYIDSCEIYWNVILEDTDEWYEIKLAEDQYIFFKGDSLKLYFSNEGYDYSVVKR